MGQYSYSQPSSSRASLPTEDYGFDAAEVSSADRRRPVNLFGNSGKNGIPERCVCGLTAVTQTSTTELNSGRIFFGCKNHKDGGHHLFKWWDEAVSEEIRELRSLVENQCDFVRGIRSGSGLECVKRLEAVKSLEAAVKNSVHVKRFETELVQLKQLILEKRLGGFDLKSVVVLVSVIIVGLISFLCINRSHLFPLHQ